MLHTLFVPYFINHFKKCNQIFFSNKFFYFLFNVTVWGLLYLFFYKFKKYTEPYVKYQTINIYSYLILCIYQKNVLIQDLISLIVIVALTFFQ